MKYAITGGHKLSGTIRVSGNKNSVFPCIAAALLTEEEIILENISDLKDTEILIQILIKLGIKVTKGASSIKIQASLIKQTTLPKELMVKLRGSIVLVGAILARMGKVHFYHPGGDIIGVRSIETHLECLQNLGANLKREDLKFTLFYPEEKNNKSYSIFLSEASVTACENLILSASLSYKKVIIKNG